MEKNNGALRRRRSTSGTTDLVLGGGANLFSHPFGAVGESGPGVRFSSQADCRPMRFPSATDKKTQIWMIVQRFPFMSEDQRNLQE
ncbi:hypothetical protein L484_017099 [Morus notabilis]|uniref:Uncharacterized protein n=1 Tax=Morus notabilis TaxID=981085 RepID=W9SC57_9ROSA|nr:hypothetical protein L484_017099 [Morus notabilis]